jgi:hypothetical protein
LLGAIVDGALAKRPAAIRRQLFLFIRILNLLSFFRHGVPLARLDAARRTAFLKRIESSRLLLFRRGFWGVRTLVLMGYYARHEAGVALGYAANTRGWQARV